MKFLDNIGFNKFREIPVLHKSGINQESNQQQNNNPNFFQNPQKDTFEPSFGRLNDLDTDIINKNLFKFLPIDSLRLELQLEQSEKKMKDVETDIKVLTFLGFDKESEKFAALEHKKMLVSAEINKYRQEYRELGMIYKVTDTITDIFQKTKNKASEAKISFMGSPVVKGIKEVFPALKAGDELKQTLNNSILFGNSCNTIFSKTVIPYGEGQQGLVNLADMVLNAEKLNSKITKILNSAKKSGSKIGNLLSSAYNKAILSLNNFKDGLKSVLPKKLEQENFFASQSSKVDPPG